MRRPFPRFPAAVAVALFDGYMNNILLNGTL
jgi:hypothetical protein